MIRNHMSIPTEQGGACPVDYRGCIEAYILSRGILSQCQKFFMVEANYKGSEEDERKKRVCLVYFYVV